MEKVKQELNRVIHENETLQEAIHYDLMYTELENNDELDQMITESKSEKQKAQQCLDLINN
jgi:hypothetical protein